MKRSIQSFLVVAIAINFVTGCSPPPPSAADGQKILEDWLDLPTLADGELKLVSFEKINGQKGQIRNAESVTVQSYSLDYQGEVEVMKRCALLEQANLAEFDKGKFYVVNESDPNFNVFTNSIVNIGQHIDINGTVVFEKTEKGWKESKIENRILFVGN